MKKIIIILLSLFIFTGCTNNMSAKDAVKDYLELYRTQDDSVVDALDEYINSMDELNDLQKDVYKEVLLKQYKNIKYKIENEVYDGDEALITAKLTVFDLYKAQQESDEYLGLHQEEFMNDGEYDSSKYLDYKLHYMKEFTDSVEYKVDFKLKKKDNKWVVEKLSDSDLEKIHGIYHDNR